jgi:hypothetical protein
MGANAADGITSTTPKPPHSEGERIPVSIQNQIPNGGAVSIVV